MSTKEYVLYSDNGASVCQDMHIGSCTNENPAIIVVKDPTNFSINAEEYEDGKIHSELRVEIEAEQFDEIALSWCKKRQLKVGSNDDEISADLITLMEKELKSALKDTGEANQRIESLLKTLNK